MMEVKSKKTVNTYTEPYRISTSKQPKVKEWIQQSDASNK